MYFRAPYNLPTAYGRKGEADFTSRIIRGAEFSQTYGSFAQEGGFRRLLAEGDGKLLESQKIKAVAEQDLLGIEVKESQALGAA